MLNRTDHKCPTCGFKHPISNSKSLTKQAIKESKKCPNEACNTEMKPVSSKRKR